MTRTIGRSPLFVLLLAGTGISTAYAAGTGQGGRDVLHVPLSWCAVQGSPAASAPNITPEGSATADTSTDAILWRRHERPTDNIYIPQADITFRSAINDAWGTLNFPIIADPDTNAAQQGDVRGEDNTVLGTGSEFETVINDCNTAWANLGRGGIGITAVNVNLFHDGNANYCSQDAGGNWTCTPIGWGGCARPVGSNVCSAPFTARIMVADNNYLYPTVPDRTFPPSPANPAGDLAYLWTDPLDQLTGHELGHALGLDHRNANDALMRPGQNDNNGDNRTDNIALNGTEVTSLRSSALNVPGLETDPPGIIEPGRFVSTMIMDESVERDLEAPIDLGSVDLAIDKLTARAYLQMNVRGVFPREGKLRGEYWLGLDTFESKPVDIEQLKKIGAPFDDFDGVDALLSFHFANNELRGEIWIVRDGVLVQDPIRIRFERRQLIMHPHYTPPRIPKGKWIMPEKTGEIAIHDIMTAILPAPAIALQYGKPFELRAASLQGRRIVDTIDSRKIPKANKILENPSFPHCFVQEAADPGGKALTLVEGLRSSQPFHGLVGPVEVYHGTTETDGTSKFELPIPKNARPGLHLVTIGTDGTALTADCVVMVRGRIKEGHLQPDDRAGNLFSTLEGLKLIITDISARLERNSGDVELNALYLNLVRRYADLSAQLEKEMAK
jgi:hypothetical protein